MENEWRVRTHGWALSYVNAITILTFCHLFTDDKRRILLTVNQTLEETAVFLPGCGEPVTPSAIFALMVAVHVRIKASKCLGIILFQERGKGFE